MKMSNENKALTTATVLVDTLLTAIRDMVDEEVVKKIETIEKFEFSVDDYEDDINSLIQTYVSNNIRVEIDWVYVV